MQTSFDTSKWMEDSNDESLRWRVTSLAPASLKRRLFPLSCRILASSRLYQGCPEGRVLEYARTKMIPSAFPVEVLTFDGRGMRTAMVFAPGEVELMPPVEA